MAYRPHSRYRVDPDNPEAACVCMRCKRSYNISELAWQFDWMGMKLQNKNLFVCPTCLDKPAEFLRTIILPPDPEVVYNTRPEPFAIDEA